MLTIFMFTPVAQVYSTYTLPRDNFDRIRIGDGNTQLTDMEIIINNPNLKKEVRPSEVGSPYTAITASSGSGDNFPVTDHLLYSKDYTKNLKFNMTSFETTDFIGNYYSAFDLGYTEDYATMSISSMTAVQDFYSVEVHTDLSLYVSLDNLTARLYAQGFNVPWAYANFTRAKIYLMKNGLPLSNDEVHLTLVPAGSDGKPNATVANILSESGPYSPQTLPSSTWPDAPIYDFDEVTLPQGDYFILLNLTKSTSNTEPHVVWFANDTAPYTNTAYKSSNNLEGTISWDTLSSVDLVLAPELYPVVDDITYTPMQFSDPTDIGLKDNGVIVDSSVFSLPLSYIGQHKLTSTTSVEIVFTNEYKYTDTYIAGSAYSVSNSTFDQMSVNWDLTWVSPIISDYYPLVSRNQSVDVGADWTDAFNWFYNLTAPFSYDKIRHHYKIYLGTNDSAGDWSIETNSPNHLYSAIFSDETVEADRYFLGYWTTDEVDATGFNGSEINLAAVVQSNVGSLVLDDTGTVTYSVYNSTGQIIPIDPSPPANIIYNDVTPYSIPGIAYTTPGNWDSQIIFDPSIYGSDQPGFWTAVILWENGTQIGFYTQRIIVQSQTYFAYDWELAPGGGVFGTADVTRQQNDNVDVRIWYYNISEPFLTGNGTLIPTVDVSYTRSWTTGGSFVGALSPYTASVLIDATVGLRTVTIIATGAFLENHTTSFDVTVFYQLKVNPVSQSYSTNYTNNGIFFMYLTDISAANNLSTAPDDLIVTISNASVAYNLSSPADYTFTYQGAIEETWKLDLSTSTNNLAVGSYDVFVAAQYTNYRANYTKEYASDSFVLDITAPKTDIQNIGGDTSIYSYHNATISFQFVDTNHSADILDATITVTFSAVNIFYYSYAIGNIYYIEIQSNNTSLSSFTVTLDISKDNYESIVSFDLGVITVDPITTDLQVVGSPSNVSIGYPFVIIVHFTDLDNSEDINIAGQIYNITINSTDYIVVNVEYWENGLYNITIMNNDYNLNWLQITIEFGEEGYLNSTDIILVELVFVDTDVDLLTSPNNTIYYDQNVTVSIRYWDINSQFNISSPDIITFEGNFTTIFNVTNIIRTPTGEYIFLYINYIDNLGTYELNITLIEFGYLPQMITIYITIEERLTVGETDDGETDVTLRNDADAADVEFDIYISYTDDL
ncbi:MAG: hypothetical protein ACXAAM_03795, partial [Candidatus Heimdallarchaeaceae archaeon]